MPVRSQPSLSRVLGEVVSPCRNQCFMNGKIKEVRPMPFFACSVLILCLCRTRLVLLGTKLTLICSESSLKYHLTRLLVILQSYVLNLVTR